MRKFFRILHLYIGLVTGLVVFIVSITGCLWVFSDEIRALITDEIIIEQEDKPFITPTKAKEIALTVNPGHNVHGTLYGKKGKPIEVIFYEAEPEEFYRSVFLHPYTGKVLAIENHEEGFFHFVLEGHMHLWMPEEIGSQVVGVSVLLFVVMLATGLVLWFPKSKSKKYRFSFKWNETTKWRKKNNDIHSIPGFYVLALALILAFTGLVMSYDWFHKAVYTASGGEKYPFFMIPENITGKLQQDGRSELPIDRIVPILASQNPDAVKIEVHYPHSPTAAIYVELATQDGVYYSSDYRFFDQNTLEEIPNQGVYGKYREADIAEKVIRMTYDTHVGAIGGLPGKIIAFFVSLLIATLPVTGTLIWYSKKYKKSVKKQYVFNPAHSQGSSPAAEHIPQTSAESTLRSRTTL